MYNFFQNPDDRNELRKLKIINKKQKTFRVWGSGIDLEDFTPKPIPDSKVFLMVSRLLIEKGVYEFIKAASIIKKNTLM